MKKLYLFIFLNLAGFALSQETLPLYQQYLLDGQFLFNPAHLGETDDVVVNANYQKQFSKFAESPNVQSIGIHANIIDRVGAGLTFFRDQNGPISSNGLGIGASYFIPLSDDGERKDQFSFGTNINLYNMNIDYAALNPKDPGDHLLYDGNNDIFIAYANVGLQATYKNFFGGAAIVDIPLTNDVPEVNGIEPSPTKYLLNLGYQYFLTDDISLEPSVLVNLNTNSAKLIDYNFLANIFSGENAFGAGVSFRTSSDKVGKQQLSLSPLIKGKINKFTFGFTYNLGLSDIQTYAGNSFMISLGYNFDNFINTRGYRYR